MTTEVNKLIKKYLNGPLLCFGAIKSEGLGKSVIYLEKVLEKLGKNQEQMKELLRELESEILISINSNQIPETIRITKKGEVFFLELLKAIGYWH